MRRASKAAQRDVVLVVVFAACAYVFVLLTDAHERFERWAARHEEWQVDELLVLAALLTVAAGAFAWRRWREANEEIARRENLQAELVRRTTHDPLTGLPNRAVLEERLERATKGTNGGRDTVAVLFVDLDGFKAINDTQGHADGDELLVLAAARLERCVRSADTVSRVGGDEFVVLMEDLGEAERITEVANRILESLRAPFVLPGGEATVSASLGVAVTGGPSRRETRDLVREADRTMYRAKRGGGARYEISRGG